MNDVRARFEEIWPVPEVIYFADGEYYPYDGAHATDEIVAKCEELDARLDTFTRCQEIMAPALSLIDELVADLQYRVLYSAIEDDNERSQVRINQIKKILGA